MNVAVGLVDAVARVENDVVFFGVDEGADGVACVGIVPAVGAEEDYLHISTSSAFVQLIRRLAFRTSVQFVSY
ncbi:Uncharacterised protein [uncultured archaeon]|nr:Uncharacterised protein [uncultured archaeon]